MPWENKIALVTGAYSGIGRQIARQLAERGFDLFLTGRNGQALEGLTQALELDFPQRQFIAAVADLSDYASIRALAQDVHIKVPRLDMVVHNAGTAVDGLELSPQGQDVHFEVNTAAPYLLTLSLEDLLHDGAQIVLVGSSAMRMNRKLDLGELVHPRRFVRFRLYALSKLAGAAAMLSLSRVYEERGICVRIVDPGPAKTAMSQSPAVPGWFRAFRGLFKSPTAAAQRIVSAATKPDHATLNGAYFERGRPTRLFYPLSDIALQDAVALAIRDAAARRQSEPAA